MVKPQELKQYCTKEKHKDFKKYINGSENELEHIPFYVSETPLKI